MNEALEAGKRAGVDVEALYKKYTGTGQSKLAEARIDRQNDRKDRPPPLKEFCRRCSGIGLIKEHYNHQVKDVNCTGCDGEGFKRNEDA